MQAARDHYPACPEALIVSLARSGDRDAFAELVRRRQSAVRNLMRRLSGNPALADDLAQQVFMQVWQSLRSLREAKAFPAWLKRLAVRVWLQQLRGKDALREAGELDGLEAAAREHTSAGMDLDRALAVLPAPVRLCIVLSYQEGLSHREIAELTELPLGTVKSHINRGSERLRELLSDYAETPRVEQAS